MTRLFLPTTNPFLAAPYQNPKVPVPFSDTCIALLRFLAPSAFRRGVLTSFSSENPLSQSAVDTMMIDRQFVI